MSFTANSSYFVLAFCCLFLCTSLAAQQDETDLLAAATASSPAVSPDGSTLVFVSNTKGSKNIWLADRSGANVRQLTTWENSDQVDPDWTPDGKRIVFASTRNAAVFNIWIISVDGTSFMPLTANAGANRQPRVSPDGTEIVFTSNRTGKRELWLMAIDGTNQKAIGPQSIFVNDPAWSPDGSAIVYAGCKLPPVGSGLFAGSCNLLSIRLDGSSPSQLTTGQEQDWNPDWGSRGIVFSSTRGQSQGLWVVNPDGTNLRQLTDGQQGISLWPRWDPQSGEVVFARGAALWSAATTGGQHRLVLLDLTPPTITPIIVGNLGQNGWFINDVSVNWVVLDPESGVAQSSGCGSVQLSNDTAGVTITCSAVNGVGLSASVSQTVKIDRTPPTISGMPAANCVLWPPNQKMVGVASVSATDSTSGLAPGSFLVTVTSNEQSSPSEPDIVITPNGTGAFSINLRAARSGNGTGRIYTLTATASDQAGNTSTLVSTCTVPHDQGEN